MPQELGAEVQEFPYPGGFAGVVAEQLPLHPITPEFVSPQELGAELQARPAVETQGVGVQV